MQRIEFAHSVVNDFRGTLLKSLNTQPLVKQGKRTVLVALESIYSMNCDVCPLLELVGTRGYHGDISRSGEYSFRC
ncbi:hypothetical protein BKA67DRAFT_551815 [Truncatella angustata]|uniref:Uncharacterized protein n=1 Tax=Truncatella angustata TaxID=152316 RepID=A0A9P8ZYT3_9PEZI|nr:uncharacterized protein BKA67DRAFT_551815 [Truncatella angustata]KAH6656402.1 hypothetical protein BKA67DRAFT_551815 [Truncatella angustata]